MTALGRDPRFCFDGESAGCHGTTGPQLETSTAEEITNPTADPVDRSGLLLEPVRTMLPLLWRQLLAGPFRSG